MICTEFVCNKGCHLLCHSFAGAGPIALARDVILRISLGWPGVTQSAASPCNALQMSRLGTQRKNSYEIGRENCILSRGEHGVIKLFEVGQQGGHTAAILLDPGAGVARQVHAAEGLAVLLQHRLHLFQAFQLVVVGPEIGESWVILEPIERHQSIVGDVQDSQLFEGPNPLRGSGRSVEICDGCVFTQKTRPLLDKCKETVLLSPFYDGDALMNPTPPIYRTPFSDLPPDLEAHYDSNKALPSPCRPPNQLFSPSGCSGWTSVSSSAACVWASNVGAGIY